MGKQTGIIKIEGSIEDLTFYKTHDGYLVRKKNSLRKGLLQTGQAFDRTRENQQEFGKAGKAGKLLRDAVLSILQNAKDPKLTSRLVQVLLKVIKSDPTGLRGQRAVENGDLKMLENFDFNINAKLSTIFNVAFSTNADRVSGILSIDVPVYNPADMINAPEGATHYKLVGAGAEIDFPGSNVIHVLQEGPIVPLGNRPAPAQNFSFNLTPGSRLPMMMFLGIQFFQQVNGIEYPLKGGANPLTLIKTA